MGLRSLAQIRLRPQVGHTGVGIRPNRCAAANLARPPAYRTPALALPGAPDLRRRSRASPETHGSSQSVAFTFQVCRQPPSHWRRRAFLGDARTWRTARLVRLGRRDALPGCRGFATFSPILERVTIGTTLLSRSVLARRVGICEPVGFPRVTGATTT